MKGRLGVEAARLIREAYFAGRESQSELADRFGVSQPAISYIVREKAYRRPRCPTCGEPRRESGALAEP